MTTTTDSSPVKATPLTLNELRRYCRDDATKLFAILDACGEPRIPAKARELEARAVSLYSGDAEYEHWAIAPYLAEVDEPLLDWIVTKLEQQPWGIFIMSSEPLKTMRQHFRRFLTVEDSSDRQLLFRFYDPRVTGVFLQSCTPAEATQFFGPASAFALPGDAAGYFELRLSADTGA